MRIFRSFPLLLLAALAACEQPIEASPGREAPPPVAPPPEASTPRASPAIDEPAQVSSLAGEWRVAGIDGQSLDEPIGLSLTGDEQQLWWEPRCAGVARTYRIEGQRIVFGSTQPPRPVGAPTPPVCAIGLPPRLNDVSRALDDAVSISRTSGNGILISGPSHSLTLFSQ